MTRRILIVAAALLTALAVVTGCTRSVGGTAVKAGSGDVQRNNNSEQQYPNLLKDCEVPTHSTSRAPSSAQSAAGRPPTRPD